MADGRSNILPLKALRAVHLKLVSDACDDAETAHHLGTASGLESIIRDAEGISTNPSQDEARAAVRRPNLLADYACRMEILIEQSDDPGRLMGQILHNAEQAGWIDASDAIRTSSAWVFVIDLLLDNPRIRDWINIAEGWLEPSQIEDEEQLLDSIR